MNDFGSLTMAQARAYAAAYAQGAPLRAQWLAGEVAATGGSAELLADPSALTGLWEWLVDRIGSSDGPASVPLATDLPDDDPQVGPRPPWHDQKPNRYMSDGLLWLVDAIGCHLAGLAQRVFPDATWEVHQAPSKRDVNNRRTVLTPVGTSKGFADPARMVYGTLSGYAARGEPLTDDALSPLWVHLAGEHAEQPPPDRVARGSGSDSDRRDAGHVPALAGPAVELPGRWQDYGDRLDAAGRREIARQIAALPGFGIEPGGLAAGRAPEPGERWIALFDDVRVLVGDAAIEALVEHLDALAGTVRCRRERREYVEVVSTATDEQLAAVAIVVLALQADLG